MGVHASFEECDKVFDAAVLMARDLALLPAPDAERFQVAWTLALSLPDVDLGAPGVGDGFLDQVQSFVACEGPITTRAGRTTSTSAGARSSSSRATGPTTTPIASTTARCIHVHVTISVGANWAPLADAPAVTTRAARLHGLHGAERSTRDNRGWKKWRCRRRGTKNRRWPFRPFRQSNCAMRASDREGIFDSHAEKSFELWEGEKRKRKIAEMWR